MWAVKCCGNCIYCHTFIGYGKEDDDSDLSTSKACCQKIDNNKDGHAVLEVKSWDYCGNYAPKVDMCEGGTDIGE